VTERDEIAVRVEFMRRRLGEVFQAIAG